MRPKLKKVRYFAVFFITAIIFFLGFSMGFIVNAEKSTIMAQIAEEQKLDYLSLQLQSMYINDIEANSTDSCRVLEAALDKSWESLAKSYSNLVRYKEAPDANPDEVELIERQNILNDIRYWMLLEKSKKDCSLRDSVSIAFFYQEKSCGSTCGAQSVVLEYFKKIFEDRLLLFHINTEIEESMTDLLISQHNISVYPAMIINGQKISGFQDKAEMLNMICSSFKTPQIECTEK